MTELGDRTGSARADPVRLCAIRDVPLSVDEVLAAVGDDAAGGIALFVGTVRADDRGRSVTGLEYSAHPSAVERLREVAVQLAAEYDVVRLAVVHRVGALRVGDLAVVTAVACGHRGEAFTACRELIDRLKATVPIWKHQVFADGGSEWVGSP